MAAQHQYLISAGKRGDVCIFDVRQRTLRHKFQAHESAVKCLAIDPMEEFFVTGSADGDIKVHIPIFRIFCKLRCFFRCGVWAVLRPKRCIHSLGNTLGRRFSKILDRA